MNAHAFLVALTIVLGAAAVTTVLFQRLHQPVVLGYILAGFLPGPNVPYLTGNGVRTSLQSGMSLAQIGEFSFIIAGLGLSLGATGDFLYPVAVAVSALTTLTTPWLIRASDPVARFVEGRLPERIRQWRLPRHAPSE